MSLPDNGPAAENRLSTPDAEALDALVEAGFDPSRMPESLRARGQRAARLLGLLDGGIETEASPDLVERTLASLGITPAPHELTLCAEDASALEALASAGFDAAKVNDTHRPRAALHARLAGLATDTVPTDLAGESLSDRTFDLVMLAADRPATLPFPTSESRPSVRRINYFDLVGVAAMALLGVSVMWPVFSAVQHRQAKSGCMANLGSVASAMSSYAGAYRDSLPVASASIGSTWWNVGNPGESNSANLFTLARSGYTAVKNLTCPANPRGNSGCPSIEEKDWKDIRDISYSYQVMFGTARPKWNGPDRVAVLADRSPIVLRNLRGEPAYYLENSPNHLQQGQDVLFSDGSAQWTITPELSRGDNLWLPRPIEEHLRRLEGREPLRLQGNETPGSEVDAFLGP